MNDKTLTDAAAAIIENIPAPPPPTKIPEEAMYKVSNCAFRVNNILLQEEILRRDKQDAIKALNDASLEMGTKYGLDPKKHRVLPDGTIVPVDHPMVAGQHGA